MGRTGAASARPCFKGERGLTPVDVFTNMSATHFIDPSFAVEVWGFERFQVSWARHDADAHVPLAAFLKTKTPELEMRLISIRKGRKFTEDVHELLEDVILVVRLPICCSCLLWQLDTSVKQQGYKQQDCSCNETQE